MSERHTPCGLCCAEAVRSAAQQQLPWHPPCPALTCRLVFSCTPLYVLHVACRLCSPEAVVEAMLPARRTACIPAATAAARAALDVVPWQPAAAASAPQADADTGQAEGAKRPRFLQHLTVQSGCWADLKPLLQLWSPQQLTVCTLPAITDALQLSGRSSSLLGRYYFQVS